MYIDKNFLSICCFYIVDFKNKKPAEVRILGRGVAGVVEIRVIQPTGIVNHNLTFKSVSYRVYQNVAPPNDSIIGPTPLKWGVSF